MDGTRARSVSDGFESYVLPIKPIRIRAVPGMTQSCPDLRRRNQGKTKFQWDPRNVIHEEEYEDERKARVALMRMYR